MAVQGGQGQLRRYHFRARLAFLALVGLALLVVHAMANFSGWLVVPDTVVIAVLGWLVWQERDAVRFLLAWRSAVIGAGLGHTYQTTNRKGEKIDKIARPQVRRLWVSSGLVRVHVLPVAGQAVKLEQAVENLAGLLGMSRAVIAERRPGLRSMRYVLDFHRPAGQLATQRVELPRQRVGAVEDGGLRVREVPRPLQALPVPDVAAATGVGAIDPETGRIIGQRMMFDWYLPGELGRHRFAHNVPVEVEFRPDLASRLPFGDMLKWRRTTDLDGVSLDDYGIPPQCRQGLYESGGTLLGELGCSAYHRLPPDEQRRVVDGADAEFPEHLPCSECPYVPREPIAAEAVPVSVLPDGTDWPAFLRAIPVGRRADGNVWTVGLYDTQGLLVVGASGAGKSGLLWALNIGLAPALIAGVVELRGVDPKGNELFYGYNRPGENGFFMEYADEREPMVTLLETAVEDLAERKAYLRKNRLRKFVPSVETPLVVVEIDELIMLQAKVLTDSKLAKRAESAIVTLLTQGRSYGFMLVGGIQDPRKEALDMRDLFQVTVALRMEDDMAMLVLSRAAVQAGASTKSIPLGPAGAGTGYVMDVERSGSEVMQVRAFWAADEDVNAWNDFLVEIRALDESKRYEAAQKASQRLRQDVMADVESGEVIPLRPAQTA